MSELFVTAKGLSIDRTRRSTEPLPLVDPNLVNKKVQRPDKQNQEDKQLSPLKNTSRIGDWPKSTDTGYGSISVLGKLANGLHILTCLCRAIKPIIYQLRQTYPTWRRQIVDSRAWRSLIDQLYRLVHQELTRAHPVLFSTWYPGFCKGRLTLNLIIRVFHWQKHVQSMVRSICITCCFLCSLIPPPPPPFHLYTNLYIQYKYT
jgi:hypothetical protein